MEQTRMCDGSNSSYSSSVQPPIRVDILDGIMKEIATQTASFLRATAGSQRAPKKKYSQLKERVKRAIDNYGRADRLIFLRVMAHLSWF